VSSGGTHEQYIAQIEWVDIGLPGVERNWLCVSMLVAVTRLHDHAAHAWPIGGGL